jgi:hypothetical protein
MKAYLEDGPMDGMEVLIDDHRRQLLVYEYGLWKYIRTGRSFAGLMVFRYEK